jgi:hypothetical protein
MDKISVSKKARVHRESKNKTLLVEVSLIQSRQKRNSIKCVWNRTYKSFCWMEGSSSRRWELKTELQILIFIFGFYSVNRSKKHTAFSFF